MKLTDMQVQMFQNDGYLVAESVVTNANRAPVSAEYEAGIDRRARAPRRRQDHRPA